MAENKINIQLETTLKETVSQQKNLYTQLKNAAPNANYKNTDTMMRQLEATAGKKNLNAREINLLIERISKFALALQDIASKSTKLDGILKDTSEKLKKLEEKQKELLAKNKEAQSKLGTDSKGQRNLTGRAIKEILKEYPDVKKLSGSGKDKAVVDMSPSGIKTFLDKKGDPSIYGGKAAEAYQAIINTQKAYLKQINNFEKENTKIEADINTEKAAIAERAKNLGQGTLEDAQNLSEEGKAQLEANKILTTIYTKLSTIISDTNSLGNAQTKKEIEAAEKANEGQGVTIDTSGGLPTKGTTSGLGKVFKQFTLYQVALRSVKKAAREAATTIKELDKSLTEQAMVTGKTRKETFKLLKQYRELSMQLGTTTKDVAAVATEYMRQGKSTEDAIKLTEAAISAAKVAGIQASESVNYLTTALNGFQLSANDAMKVSDKFASVAANAAVSYDEIATALSKVASQANLAGMSIDYTTALLAKGIETTREAPETIGTALKTIIARMRELTDYGETLEDGVDINNVETQLAYVGIQLREQSGELRSTEDVLDDLGQKWDTLNTNQQAAVAKALAGTRQQSRLIAMMSDYERVTELQEISARSAGATMTQMETYLDGMEAALNKVNVAWEKIVKSFTANNVIIWFIDGFGSILNNLVDIIPLAGTLVLLGANALKNKVLEVQYNKQLTAINNDQKVLENEKNIIAAETLKNELERNAIAKRQYATKQAELVTSKKQTIEILKQKQADGDNNQQAIKQAEEELQALEMKAKQADLDAKVAEGEFARNEQTISLLEKENTIIKTQQGLLTSLGTGWRQATTYLLSYVNQIPKMITQIKAQRAAVKEQGRTQAATSASYIPVIGWIIWGVIMGSAIFSAVTSAITFFTSKIKDSSEKTKELSASIYTLNNTKVNLEKGIKAIDDYDNRLIKTKEDAEALEEELSKVADSLSDDLKEKYNNATSNAERRSILERAAKETEEELREDRLRQLKIYEKMKSKRSGNRRAQEYFNNEDNVMAIRKLAVANLQQIIDDNPLTNPEIEALATELAGSLTIDKAADFATYTHNWTTIINALDNLKSIKINGQTYSAIELLQSDTAPLKERAEIYKEIVKTLQSQGADNQFISALGDEFGFLDDLMDRVGAEALAYADKIGLGAKKINDLYDAGKTLVKEGLIGSVEEWTDNFNDLVKQLAQTGGDIGAVIENLFSKQLKTAENYEDAYNTFVNTFANLVSTGVLNMGQNLDSFSNSISVFYEKAKEWSTMSDTDKTSFMSDYADMFGGSDGAELLRAFENGDYQKIEDALKQNDALQRKLAERLEDIDKELAIEESRVGDARNEAYIKYLKEWKEKLENSTDVFKADLKLWVEQEQTQLDAYKEYLENQQNALQKSLDTRKEAYEKYFDAIDKLESEEDYQEKADQILMNLNKLGAGTNGATETKRIELTKQLEDLEKERIKELRQQSRDAITENIDDQVNEINDKFDELLDNNRALLAAMRGEMENPMEYAQSLYNSKLASGATDLELAQYMEEWKSGALSGYDINWDAIKQNGEINNISISVSDTTLTNAETATFLELVKKMMTSMGTR